VPEARHRFSTQERKKRRPNETTNDASCTTSEFIQESNSCY